MELQAGIGVGYVVPVSDLDELMGFIYQKDGYFSLLLPNHVTGFYASGGVLRYFDPNAGTVSFTEKRRATNFISDDHGSDDFKRTYAMDVGDVVVVQLVQR